MQDNIKMIGFKFVITTFFPHTPPKVFLDEKENPRIYEYIDYLEKGNIIRFSYLEKWRDNYSKTPADFTLQKLLIQVNNLFSYAPPIDMYIKFIIS